MNSPYSPNASTNTARGFVASYYTDINARVSASLLKSQADSSRLYYDTAIAHMIVESLTSYVIGSGLVPTASPERSLVDWTEEERKKFCTQAEAYWRLFTNSPQIDYYGKSSFKTLQKIAFRNILLKGDVLRHMFYSSKRQGYRPCIQLLSGQWVKNPSAKLDDKNMVGGVALDDRGIETGYYIAKTNDQLLDTYDVNFVSRYNKAGLKEYELVKLNASESNQVRGIPLLAPCRDDILNLQVAKTNHITKFIVEAILTAFITTPEDKTAGTETLNAIKSLGVQSQEAMEDYDDENLELLPGNVIKLQPGEDVRSIQNSQSSMEYGTLEKNLLTTIGGAVGVPYEMLIKQYGSSYSASRATIMSASKHFAELRQEFAEKFCNEFYEMVIDYGIRTGLIDAPGYLEGSEGYRKAILSVTWIGPTPVIMDPVKEANAQMLMVSANLTTKEKAVRDLSGMDFEEVIERRAYEQATEESYGFGLSPDTESNNKTNNNEEEGKDNE